MNKSPPESVLPFPADETSADVPQVVLAKPNLELVLAKLLSWGYRVLGPRVEQSAVVYGELSGLTDLPRGYRDEQAAGSYRLVAADHDNYFDFNVGPQSWKQFLFPPQACVASGERREEGWHFKTPAELDPAAAPLAFIGVRACELAAIAIQDRIFLQGAYVDPIYRQRRESLFLLAVNCSVAASTCFCTSMGTGPRCTPGQHVFDLALTELEHDFVVEIGSARGGQLLEGLPTRPADAAARAQARAKQQQAEQQISKQFQASGIREVLLENLDHPHWDDVAQRCLSCTNCTMVCPTCFCSTVTEVSDLSGDHVRRERQWDSCFNIDFGYMAGGIVRDQRRSRFRQWLTHKLASWHDQFDSSGCVGCGRCITWCPVGIDLTAEVDALRSEPGSPRRLPVIASPDKPSVCRVTDESTTSAAER